ncbi:MAG TPA: hypothetical protein VF175_04230 [Lacipirellula sp.]
MTRRSNLIAALFVAAGALVAQRAAAQSSAGQTQEMQLPPGSPVISISTMMPQELRVGEQFEYQIDVKNVSDNIAVHGLVIEQQKSKTLQIESTQIEGAQGTQQDPNQQAQQDEQKKKTEQAKASGQSEQSQAQQAQSNQQKNRWTIAMLGPGQTQTIRVTAIAEKQGQANVCLMVTDFRPSLCLQTEVVKPNLELVKTAPAQANLCDDIEVSYYVKNIGTGNAERFVIRDSLGDGLTTIDGDKNLEFAVDGLKEGEVRKFVATLRAAKAGEFSSRAVAELAEGGGKTNSNKTTIAVSQADLAVQINGPDAHYLGRPANYTILVANRGQAPAASAVLLADFADGAELLRFGEVQPAEASALNQASSQPPTKASPQPSSEQQPADQAQQAAAKKQSAGQSGQTAGNVSIENADETWDLGTLEPGQAVKVPVVVRFNKPGKLEHVAVAEFACGNEARKNAARAVARTQTELIALPDLMLAVVDSEGTVPQGEQVSYTIIVKNQGEAADQNVQITAELPEGLEFVSAAGPTDPKNEGQTLNFGPIKSLDPGDRAVYQVVTKATGEGQVLFHVELQSEALKKPATAEEPTRLFSQTAQAAEASQQQ